MPKQINENVTVKHKAGTEDKDLIPVEIIVDSIVAIGKGMKQLQSSRLKESSVITLIVRASGVGRGDVEKVLGHLADIENLFLKPKKK